MILNILNHKNSVKISILVNLIVACIFMGFIYSAYHIIDMNSKIQEDAFQNRFQSRLYLKTISNLRLSQIKLSLTQKEKNISLLEEADDLILSAQSDYKILLSEIGLHSTDSHYTSQLEIFKNLTEKTNLLIESKILDNAQIELINSQIESLIKTLYDKESEVWQSEAEKFFRLSQFKERSSQTFYYLTFMFAFFLVTLIFFTYLRYKLINKINLQNDQLVLQARMSTLGVMSAELAHEINTPLMVIDGRVKQINAEIMNQSIDHEKLKKNFETVQRNIKRIHTIVKNFKLLSKDGKLDRAESTSINELFSELKEIIAPRVENYLIEIRFIPSTNNTSVQIIKIQILQVLINLLNNSVDAIKNDALKWIEVSAIESDNFVKIIITDSGNGINQKLANKLFDPFFTTKNSNEGTGLGLSLSRKIAEEHRGSLIYNPDHQNTQFILSLPYK